MNQIVKLLWHVRIMEHKEHASGAGREYNTLASDASVPGSTPGRGTLELETVYHPFGVGEMVLYRGLKIVSKQ